MSTADMIEKKKSDGNNDDDDDEIDHKTIEFMIHYKERVSEYISNAYEIDHTVRVSPKTPGVLRTSLVEDVMSLIEMQHDALVDAINNDDNTSKNNGSSCRSSSSIVTKKGRAMLVDGIYSILNDIRQTQYRCRTLLTTSLKDTCAAANDFTELSTRIEQFIENIEKQHPFLAQEQQQQQEQQETGDGNNNNNNNNDDGDVDDMCWLLRLGYDLSILYSRDAVYAAEYVHVYIMQSVRNNTSVITDLFSIQWEVDWTDNQVIYDLTNHIDHYLIDIRTYLDSDMNEYLYQKTLVATVKAVVCLYIRCLVEKAHSLARTRTNRRHQRSNTSKHGHQQQQQRIAFQSPHRSLVRMAGDISILMEFFHNKVRDYPSSTTLWRIMKRELDMLTLIREVLSSTTSDNTSSLDGFVLVLHQRTGANPLVTRYFVSDLCQIFDNNHNSDNHNHNHSDDNKDDDYDVHVVDDDDDDDNDQHHQQKHQHQHHQHQTIDRSHLIETLKQLQPDLHMLTTELNERPAAKEQELASSSGKTALSEISYVRLDHMLKVLYEDRLSQGIMPCYFPCMVNDDDDDDIDLMKQLRSLANNIRQQRDVVNDDKRVIMVKEQIRSFTGHIKKDVMPKIRSGLVNNVTNLRKKYHEHRAEQQQRQQQHHQHQQHGYEI